MLLSGKKEEIARDLRPTCPGSCGIDHDAENYLNQRPGIFLRDNEAEHLFFESLLNPVSRFDMKVPSTNDLAVEFLIHE